MSTYTDRRGHLHVSTVDSVIRKRSGVFAVIHCSGRILVTWPDCAPDVAELPGGGIDAGETPEQALVREVYEETGVELPYIKPLAIVHRNVHFYADDCMECWDYEQRCYLLDFPLDSGLLFPGDSSPPDALKATWMSVSKLRRIRFHALHWKLFENCFVNIGTAQIL